MVELMTVLVVMESVSGYDGGPAGASGSRFSEGSWSVGRADAGCSAGCQIAGILANAVTIAVAHGQVDGIRSRSRPPLVSLAGTCRSR